MSNVMQYAYDADTDVQDPQVVFVLKPPNMLRH
jgi:hypothetical protein